MMRPDGIDVLREPQCFLVRTPDRPSPACRGTGSRPPNVPVFSCGRQSDGEPATAPVCCNALLGGGYQASGLPLLGAARPSSTSASTKMACSAVTGQAMLPSLANTCRSNDIGNPPKDAWRFQKCAPRAQTPTTSA